MACADRRCLLVLGLILAGTVCTQDLGAEQPKYIREGNLMVGTVPTESGPQRLVYNKGLADGADFEKIFGRTSGTGLWSNNRRADRYGKAFRIMATVPNAKYVIGDAEHAMKLFDSLSKTGRLAEVSAALGAVKTNYIKGGTLAADLRNTLSKYLRRINPKSYGGGL